MNEAEVNHICPEDEIGILLRAEQIPNRSVVTKKTGSTRYVLRHDLIVYPISTKKTVEKSDVMTMKGFFLIGPCGDVNQIASTQELIWRITAEEFTDKLQLSWQGPSQ